MALFVPRIAELVKETSEDSGSELRRQHVNEPIRAHTQRCGALAADLTFREAADVQKSAECELVVDRNPRTEVRAGGAADEIRLAILRVDGECIRCEPRVAIGRVEAQAPIFDLDD